MANGAVSRLGNAAVQISPKAPATAAAQVAPRSSGKGNRSEASSPDRRQLVNLDGQTLNKQAPRGTYLNIIV